MMGHESPETLQRYIKQTHEDIARAYDQSDLLAWKERATETLDELKIALKGYGKEPGLIAVIQNLTNKIEEYDDAKKWITRLVIGYIITVILGLIVIAAK